MLSNNIMDYHVVAQGKTSIPGVDDGEECELTDVRPFPSMQPKREQKNFHGKANALMQNLLSRINHFGSLWCTHYPLHLHTLMLTDEQSAPVFISLS